MSRIHRLLASPLLIFIVSTFLIQMLTTVSTCCEKAIAAEESMVQEDDWQALCAQVKRVSEAMDLCESPFDARTKAALKQLYESNSPDSAKKLQQILDQYCLIEVQINPESRVKVAPGNAAARLIVGGWRQFLVKVDNQAGVTAPLIAESPNAQKVAGSPAGEITNRWLDMQMFNEKPLLPALSGLRLEYRIIELYSSEPGKREARISFNVGSGIQQQGNHNNVDVLFDCLPSRKVTLHALDENDRPTTASFTFRDQLGHVYPSPNKRLAPDMAFQSQIYRADGDTISLPDGTYEVTFSRGPESKTEKRSVTISGDGPHDLRFKVKRWIDPSLLGWWSGDHHIHAAGCAHYEDPTQGVLPQDMMLHCLGEDLKVGCNLTWGPCFDYQKQFFVGRTDKLAQYPYLLHYDIEVSGFGSDRSGHLVLLDLKQQMPPGADSDSIGSKFRHDKHWPTLGLNTLKWAKQQGAITGTAHSGLGLKVKGEVLPSYEVPKFDGIGAMEYIVDVTHQVPGPDGKKVPAVDFYALGDTEWIMELNMWYHILNVGYRTRAGGETDYPCLNQNKLGVTRSYVKLPAKLTYDAWCQGLRDGRSYVSDGYSHLMDFEVNNVKVGEKQSELKIIGPGAVTVSAKVAAYLNEEKAPENAIPHLVCPPCWHIEKTRIGDTREVPVELIVNGNKVATQNVLADGVIHDLKFTAQIERSSWLALRIPYSAHTNPIWVLVDGKSISPDRRSAEWCLKGVEQCWSQKKQFIRKEEMADAENAYDHARAVYKKMLEEPAQAKAN